MSQAHLILIVVDNSNIDEFKTYISTSFDEVTTNKIWQIVKFAISQPHLLILTVNSD